MRIQDLAPLAAKLRPFLLGMATEAANSAVATLNLIAGTDIVITGEAPNLTIGRAGNVILLYHGDGSVAGQYQATSAGLTAALAAAVSGDVVFIPPGTIGAGSTETTITLIATEDTFIGSGAYAVNNFGAYGELWTGGVAGTQEKILLRFDLSSLPSGADVISATLKLTARADYATPDTYNIYKITDPNGDWIEGSTNGAQAGSGEPCWNAKEADGSGGIITAWAGSAGLSTPGTDFINTVLAAYTGALSTNTLIELPFNASGMTVLEDWMGDATNNGFLFYSSVLGGAKKFDTRDEPTADERPRLSITYEESPSFTIPSGVEVVGLTKNTIIAGNITNNGKLTHITVDGSVTGGEYFYFNSDGELVTNEQINSEVADGTTPFVIGSTTLVSNLNADLLDGNEASDLLDKATYDTDDDGLIDTAHGGTELDTSSSSGIPHLESGAWSILKRLSPGADTELTIATGEITVSQLYHRVDTEGDGASDDLDTINGLANDGELLILHPENDARDIVLKHGTGNIYIPGGEDITLDSYSYHVLLIYDSESTSWCVVGGGSGGGGGSSTFVDLTDTPADFTDDAGKYPRVNSGEDALEFVAPDASEIGYTPAVLTDWDSDTDPGNVDDGLDQLAERLSTVEDGSSKDIFVATASQTVANTTDETTLFGSGEGSLTLPADYFTAGRSLRIHMRGQLGDTGTPTINIKLKLGSTVIASTGPTALTGITDVEWMLDLLLTCRSAGESGSLIAGGLFDYDDGSEISLSSGTAVTVDTTGSLTLDVSITWGTADASNTITTQEAIVEMVDPNAGEGGGNGGVSTLDDLSDVNEGTPSDGDVLTYDGTASEWVSEAPSGGSGSTDILQVQVFT